LSLTKDELKSWVKEAMEVSALECPDCHATFTAPARYTDHRIGEYLNKRMDEVKTPDPEKLVLDCKDGICKLIDERLEALKVEQKGEEVEEAGLFSTKDEPE